MSGRKMSGRKMSISADLRDSWVWSRVRHKSVLLLSNNWFAGCFHRNHPLCTLRLPNTAYQDPVRDHVCMPTPPPHC
jgi:hypothetical protein